MTAETAVPFQSTRTSEADRSRPVTPASSRLPAAAVPALVSAIAFAVYATTLVLLYRQRLGTWDNALFMQAADGYAHFSAPILHIKNTGVHQLGDHFSPILVLLAPVYRLFPAPLTLPLTQAFLIALSVYVVGSAAIRRLGAAAGGLLALAYALSFGLQSAVVAGFHENSFAAPLLAVVGSRYLEERYRAAALWTLPLLLVKEDYALVVAAVGLSLLCKGQRALAAGLGAAGALALPLTVGVIIPAFNPQGRYDYLSLIGSGDGPGSLAHTVLQLPVTLVTPHEKLITWLLTFFVTLFVSLRSPFSWVAAPLLLERFASPRDIDWVPWWHYSLPVMTILFVAAVEVLGQWQRSDRRLRRMAGQWAPACMALAAVGLVPVFALHRLFVPANWDTSPRAADLDALVAALPPGSSVQTDPSPSSFLVPHHRVYWIAPPDVTFPTPNDMGADFILVDQQDYRRLHLDGVEYAQAVNVSSTYIVVERRGDFTLLRRVD